MIAKMRMQVGETVISWGAFPEPLSTAARKVQRPGRPKFAVIEGGLQLAPIASDVESLRARSA
jgi:hypothetical protein